MGIGAGRLRADAHNAEPAEEISKDVLSWADMVGLSREEGEDIFCGNARRVIMWKESHAPDA